MVEMKVASGLLVLVVAFVIGFVAGWLTHVERTKRKAKKGLQGP